MVITNLTLIYKTENDVYSNWILSILFIYGDSNKYKSHRRLKPLKVQSGLSTDVLKFVNVNFILPLSYPQGDIW